MWTYIHVLYRVLFYWYYTVCYFTGIFYAVVKLSSMLFIDSKDSVYSVNPFTARGMVLLAPCPFQDACVMPVCVCSGILIYDNMITLLPVGKLSHD